MHWRMRAISKSWASKRVCCDHLEITLWMTTDFILRYGYLRHWGRLALVTLACDAFTAFLILGIKSFCSDKDIDLITAIGELEGIITRIIMILKNVCSRDIGGLYSCCTFVTEIVFILCATTFSCFEISLFLLSLIIKFWGYGTMLKHRFFSQNRWNFWKINGIVLPVIKYRWSLQLCTMHCKLFMVCILEDLRAQYTVDFDEWWLCHHHLGSLLYSPHYYLLLCKTHRQLLFWVIC